MAFVIADDVQDTTATTGTGSLTVSGTSPAGFQSFLAGIGNGNQTCYAIRSSTDLEVVLGTLTSGTTLSRDIVLFSTNGGAKVNWTSGTKDVYCTMSSKLMVFLASALAGAGDAGKLVKVNAGGIGFDLLTQGTGGGLDADKLDGKHYTDINPMTAIGDMIIGGASGVPARLARGAAGTFPRSNGSTLVMAAIDAADIASGTIAAARLPAATTGAQGAAQLATASEARSRAGTKSLTAGNLADLMIETAEIALTYGSTSLVSHGLGVVPSNTQAFFRCKAAEFGFAVGEEVPVGSINMAGATSANGAMVSAVDASNLRYRIGGPSNLYLNSPTGLVYQNITTANWRLFIRAWA